MRGAKDLILLLLIAGMAGTGCRKNAVDKAAFKTALNNSYSGRQECVWAAPVKFPAQADVSNDEQTKGFDALTDAGLLKRTPEEKKRFLIGSKQVNDYDLSDKGRSTWTADASQPGYGNFCYGHAEVTSIDNFTPAQDASAAQYSVSYHYAVTQLADWANTAEMRTAFPKIASDTSGEMTATATLARSQNGWTVENVHTPVAGLPAQ
jgi:hypothetical protein